MEYITILISILIFDLLLGGDNAVVIAMASRNLPPEQQKKAILLGTAGAIILRATLTVAVVILLNIPFLKAVGGLMLVYVAIKLVRREESGDNHRTAGSLAGAVAIIMLADLIMSLDNILAVAAASRGHWGLIIAGLSISIPIIIFSSRIILYIMNRFPSIIYIGAGLLGWTAGKMIMEDQKVILLTRQIPDILNDPVNLTIPIIVAALVVIYGYIINSRDIRRAKQVPLGAGYQSGRGGRAPR
ncbi:MAG: TerC family protein [Bacillota bacterium]